MHYYKFNISDWHLATSHLTLEEEAIYFKLINFYYDTESAIPKETESVIRRLRLGSHSQIVQSILQEFFVLKDNGWHHERCDKVIYEYHNKAETNKKNGKSGGRPKNNPKITQSVSKDNPNITLTTNHKPITNNYKLNTKDIDPPFGVSTEVFNDYIKLRNKLKAPVTETAIKGLQKEADKASISLEQVMILCCQNGWRGFKAEWVKNQSMSFKERDAASSSQQLKNMMLGGIQQETSLITIEEMEDAKRLLGN